MEISTEYDLETFLDEYQPLYKGDVFERPPKPTTKLEQIKKRYFSGKKITSLSELFLLKNFTKIILIFCRPTISKN